MIDFARITVKSGNGGRGASSFMHLKGKRYGKADGGDGGIGGNVYLVATRDLNTLEPFRYIKDYKAQDGQSGFSNHRRGANGQDLMIKVPVGTVIKIENLKLKIENFDLVEDGQKVLVARGGVGGRGNAKLRDEFGRRPRTAEGGEEGEAFQITLELKLIADVGLIGLPNAGKSTLLSVLTASKPAIAAYPFTTLEPNLGVMTSDFAVLPSSKNARRPNVESSYLEQPASLRPASRKMSSDNQSKSPRDSVMFLTAGKPAVAARLVLADIPGLIEGASSGKGLGDLFLRHIERTKVLVHLVDGSPRFAEASPGEQFANSSTPGVKESDTPGVSLGDAAAMDSQPKTTNKLWQDYQTVRGELKSYSKELMRKKEIIVLNKIDLVDPKTVKEIVGEFAKHRKKILAISAKEKVGLVELVDQLLRLVG